MPRSANEGAGLDPEIQRGQKAFGSTNNNPRCTKSPSIHNVQCTIHLQRKGLDIEQLLNTSLKPAVHIDISYRGNLTSGELLGAILYVRVSQLGFSSGVFRLNSIYILRTFLV